MKTELRQGQTCDSRSSDAERVDERYAEAGEAKEGGVERGQRMWQKKHRIRIPIIYDYKKLQLLKKHLRYSSNGSRPFVLHLLTQSNPGQVVQSTLPQHHLPGHALAECGQWLKETQRNSGSEPGGLTQDHDHIGKLPPGPEPTKVGL
eukprot:133896-Rhodomonas_salina.3